MLPGIGLFGTDKTIFIIVPFLRKQGFTIEAIWGPTMSDATLANAFDIPFYSTNMDDVLLRKEVDLIFILCAPYLHAQIAVKALGIGKHVLCDKPAGLSQADALKMVRAAQYYPSLISIVNHGLRFLPAFVRMRSMLQQGYVGDLTLIDVQIRMGSLLHDSYDWLCDSTMGGGTLTMVGSHVIDLITHLTGRRVNKVHAVLRTFKKNTAEIVGIRTITAPDFCSFQMELDGGGLVTAMLDNHVNGVNSQQFLVCGTEGHLAVKDSDLYGSKNSEQEILYTDELNLVRDVGVNIPTPYLKGVHRMIKALGEAFLPVEDKKGWVKEPVATAATFEDGLYVQAVIEALKKSSLEREWVKVKILTEEPDPNPVLSAAVRRTGLSI